MQRVSQARVRVAGEVVGEVGAGALVLLGVLRGDTPDEARRLALRLAHLRFLEDEEGRMNRSLLQGGGAALVVSQFTLAADCRRGRRPSFTRAAPPPEAEPLYQAFVRHLEEAGLTCATGRFGARMAIEAELEGPVTLLLEERNPEGGLEDGTP